MNIANSAMLASIIASLVTLPAASASATGDLEAAGAQLVGTSEEEFSQIPQTVSEHIGPDSMETTIETSLGTARFESSGDTFISTLESPEHRIRKETEPGETVSELEGSTVTYTVIETPSTRTTECETPRGTQETTIEDGERETTFTGTERAEVLQRCDHAREQLQDGLTELATMAADLGMAEQEVSITELDEETEYVELTNTGPVPVDLANWTVEDASGNGYTFDSVTLEPDESIRLKSDEAAADCDRFCWDQVVWNNGGDTAILTNADGEQQDSLSYGD
jgi:hypothetical protein